MAELETLSSNLNYLAKNWAKIVDDFFMSFGDEFIKLVQSQLQKGEDANGLITPEYRGGYGRNKSSYPNPNLYDTGDFYKKMVFTEFNEIISTDWKMPKLMVKYGDAILTPQDKRLTQLVNSEMIPKFELYIENLLLQGV